jgi:Tfp pilus assembly protein PilF
MTEAKGTHTAGGGPAKRSGADRVLVVVLVLVFVGVLAIGGLILYNVFGPEQQPRTEAERLMQEGEEAVRAAPDSPDGHVTLGMAYFEIGDYDRAEEEFETAEELMDEAGASTTIAEYNLAHVYRVTERHDEAVDRLVVVVEREGDEGETAPDQLFHDARYWLGVEYLRAGQAEQTIVALEPLLEGTPFDAEAAKVMAEAHESLGDAASARALYERVLEVQPDDAEAAAGLERVGQ